MLRYERFSYKYDETDVCTECGNVDKLDNMVGDNKVFPHIYGSKPFVAVKICGNCYNPNTQEII